MRIVTQTQISACPLRSRGKVRDIYEVDEDTLLIVTTDRMSAYDVIMGEPIPYKGVILNQITLFWMDKFQDIIPNHLVESDVSRFPACLAPWADELEGRAVLVRKARPLPVECIVRGYLSGSGWKDYQATGKVCGIELPAGLKQAQKLPEPIFTPAAKAEVGVHDENVTFEKVCEMYGENIASQIRDLTLTLYKRAAEYAATRGIIIADTKFEFGLDENGNVCLMDEVLTPDSSRFWPADQYNVGMSPPSFDKQFVRDWLETQDWNKTPPAPIPPQEILEKTSAKYREALVRLTGTDVA